MSAKPRRSNSRGDKFSGSNESNSHRLKRILKQLLAEKRHSEPDNGLAFKQRRSIIE